MDTTEDMTIRQRETFGPLLMVITYKDAQEVIDYVNQRDRPLAFYPFTKDKKLADRYIDRIMSGGVSVNDALFHVAQHDLPFGGVGHSGMGNYRGYDGFRTFSHARSVYKQGFVDLAKLAGTLPPYGEKIANMLNSQIKK